MEVLFRIEIAAVSDASLDFLSAEWLRPFFLNETADTIALSTLTTKFHPVFRDMAMSVPIMLKNLWYEGPRS